MHGALGSSMAGDDVSKREVDSFKVLVAYCANHGLRNERVTLRLYPFINMDHQVLFLSFTQNTILFN